MTNKQNQKLVEEVMQDYYSRREKIEKQESQTATEESFNEIDILNKLDEQNERNS